MSRFFLRFCGKLACKKTQQITDKSSEHNRRTVLTRVSSGGVKFVFYPLPFLHFTSSLFASTPLCASATTEVRPTPPCPAQSGIRKSETMWLPPPTADEDPRPPLSLLLQSPRFLERNLSPLRLPVRRCLRRRPTFPPDFGNSSPLATAACHQQLTNNQGLSDFCLC